MIEQASGSVVNISSANALMGLGPEHLYTAAKGAVVEPHTFLSGRVW